MRFFVGLTDLAWFDFVSSLTGIDEENLASIRKRGGQYLVGTPRRQMKRFEAELLKDDWTQVRPDVEVKQIAIA